MSGLAKYFAVLALVAAASATLAAILQFAGHAPRQGIVLSILAIATFALGLAAWIYRDRLD